MYIIFGLSRPGKRSHRFTLDVQLLFRFILSRSDRVRAPSLVRQVPASAAHSSWFTFGYLPDQSRPDPLRTHLSVEPCCRSEQLMLPLMGAYRGAALQQQLIAAALDTPAVGLMLEVCNIRSCW